MEIQIIGKKGSGKSTLIHFLTGSKNPKGVLELIDERVDWLVQMSSSKKRVYAKVEILDTPPFKSGVEDENFFEKQVIPATKGKDAILYCLRNFSGAGTGEPDPMAELDLLETFIILSDLHTVESRLLRLNDNKFKRTNMEDLEKKILTEKILPILESNVPLRKELEPQHFQWAEKIGLVSYLKSFAVLNCDERLYKMEDTVKKITQKGIPTVPICSKFELELSQMEQEEAENFRKDFGIKSKSKSELAKKILEGIDLVSFLTTGPKESRAWLTKSGSKAPQAAGKIHSDLERGFIRAQVVHFEDLKSAGTLQKAKNQNLMRSEGKEYIIRDGDVVEFFFSV